MNYFKPDKNCYIWNSWQGAMELKVSFSSSTLEVLYGESPILKLKYLCKSFLDFQNLLFDLDNFWENPPRVRKRKDKDTEIVPFLSRLFLYNLLFDFYEMIEIIPEEKSKMCLSLAFLSLILRKEIFKEKELVDLYCLMNFCREKVICYYIDTRKSGLGKREDIKYVRLLCRCWIDTFKKYGEFFEAPEKESIRKEKEMWKILHKDYEEGEPDWYDLELYDFWSERAYGMRAEFFSMIKEITSWFSTECYNIDAMASLLKWQKKLEHGKLNQ